MGFGIRSRPTTPTIPVKRLAEIGVRRVSFSRLLTGSALMGMQKALEVFMHSIESGKAEDRPDLVMGIEDITALMNYELINALENEFSLKEDLERRYKGGAADLVVRGGH